METESSLALAKYFADLEDPRLDRSKRHKLVDIVLLAICAVIGGAESWTDVELFGKSKLGWFERFLELPNGIPSHDTIGRVFSLLNPEQFQACFLNWIRVLTESTGLKLIAIDGKTLRRSHDRKSGKKALHLVSAWATENSLTLGQVAVDEKSNEITAIPKLLAFLDLKGALVSIDAMGCQKDIAAEIRRGEGDYLLAVKENQERLYDDVKDCFQQAEETDYAEVRHTTHVTEEDGHGRHERRECTVIVDPPGIRDKQLWKDLRVICMVYRERTVNGVTTDEVSYHIGSRQASAEAYARFIRGHWSIENKLHWSLDVTFQEDQNRVRTDNAPENFGLLRRMALSLLKRDTSTKGSLRAKRKRCGWDVETLETIVANAN